MHASRLFVILAVCAVGLSAPAKAQTTEPIVKLPNEIEFKAPVCRMLALVDEVIDSEASLLRLLTAGHGTFAT